VGRKIIISSSTTLILLEKISYPEKSPNYMCNLYQKDTGSTSPTKKLIN
jgi:hypothetical protein